MSTENCSSKCEQKGSEIHDKDKESGLQYIINTVHINDNQCNKKTNKTQHVQGRTNRLPGYFRLIFHDYPFTCHFCLVKRWYIHSFMCNCKGTGLFLIFSFTLFGTSSTKNYSCKWRNAFWYGALFVIQREIKNYNNRHCWWQTQHDHQIETHRGEWFWNSRKFSSYQRQEQTDCEQDCNSVTDAFPAFCRK